MGTSSYPGAAPSNVNQQPYAPQPQPEGYYGGGDLGGGHPEPEPLYPGIGQSVGHPEPASYESSAGNQFYQQQDPVAQFNIANPFMPILNALTGSDLVAVGQQPLSHPEFGQRLADDADTAAINDEDYMENRKLRRIRRF